MAVVILLTVAKLYFPIFFANLRLLFVPIVPFIADAFYTTDITLKESVTKSGYKNWPVISEVFGVKKVL